MSVKKDRVFKEALNPHFGYYYTVKETLKKTKTKYQNIELIDTEEFGRVLLLDNITQVVESNEFMYHEPMVHPAMCSHPDPQSVLVIGGGDGGILREVLKYPTVKRVEHAELDEGVINFSKEYLTSVHAGSFDDPRVNINVTDGRKYADEHPGEFDVVIMDMTDPFGPSKMLYTNDFFRIIKRSFKDRAGMFVMHSESPISRPVAFGCITKTLGSTFAHVNPLYTYIQMYAVLWSISLSSDEVDIASIKASTIESRLKQYGIENLKLYNGATHGSMLVTYPYIEEILKQPARIITDAEPDFPDNFIL
ncbi:polyamine aminopropyltransferase [Chitinispirillales bacterium ANBcel5]|uniref:polyamine aminopropyltransferase n=1 Tax=Cellulosispirillum alkaliphilum TaxID=3039283 RepID=UPI002A538922|nr:polyamine aminopropyltransferase [Chitinispirillales bacterium ANBcel5]